MPHDLVPGAPLPPIELRDGVVRLRAFVDRDLAAVRDASTDELIPKISTVPRPYSDDAGRAYIDRQHHRLTSGEGWSLAITSMAAHGGADTDTDTTTDTDTDDAADVAVGQVGLWIGNLRRGRAEIGYWVAPTFRGRGSASRAVRLLSDWAFEHLDVHRLSLFIEPWNEASIQTALRAGFTRDGILRGWERIDGEPKDMMSFARLRSDRSAVPTQP